VEEIKMQQSELVNQAGSALKKAADRLQNEVKRNPYATLGTAVSVGFLFGRGWLRAVSRIGVAYLFQELARQGFSQSTSKSTQTLH